MSFTIQVNEVIRVIFQRNLFSRRYTAHVINWHMARLNTRIFDPKTMKCDSPLFGDIYDMMHNNDDYIRQAWRIKSYEENKKIEEALK